MAYRAPIGGIVQPYNAAQFQFLNTTPFAPSQNVQLGSPMQFGPTQFGNPYDAQLGQPFAQDAGPNSFGDTPNAIFQQQMDRNFQNQPGSVNEWPANYQQTGYRDPQVMAANAGYQAQRTREPFVTQLEPQQTTERRNQVASQKFTTKQNGPFHSAKNITRPNANLSARNNQATKEKWASKGGQSREQEARQFLQGQGVAPTAAPEQYAQDVNQLRQQNLRVGGSPDDPMMTMDPYGRGIGDFGQQELNPETQQQLNDLGTVQSLMRYNQARAKKGIEPDLGSLSPGQMNMYNQQMGYQAANQPKRAPAMGGMNGVGGGNRQGLPSPILQRPANGDTFIFANDTPGFGYNQRPAGPEGPTGQAPGGQPPPPRYPHQNVNPGNFAPQPTGNDLYGNALPGRPGKTAPQAPTGYVPRPDPRMGIPTRNTGMAPTGGGGGQGMAPPSNPGGSFGGAYGNPANQGGGFGGGGPALTFGNQNNYGGYGQPQGGGGMMNNLPGILGGLGIQPSGRTTTTTTQRMPTQRYVTTNQRQFTY